MPSTLLTPCVHGLSRPQRSPCHHSFHDTSQRRVAITQSNTTTLLSLLFNIIIAIFFFTAILLPLHYYTIYLKIIFVTLQTQFEREDGMFRRHLTNRIGNLKMITVLSLAALIDYFMRFYSERERE